MKKYLFLISLVICFMIKADGVTQETDYRIRNGEEYKIEKLLDAIRKVESQNGKYLEGKNGEMGPYQMKKIVIDDVNNILGKSVYKYEDAYNEEKAREICRLYMEYWSRKAGCFNIETMARIWNGGPKGYKKESTLKYWNNIRSILYEL